MKTENNLSFNLNWYRILQKYSPSVQKEVIFAVLHYASTGEILELKKSVSKVAFEFIRVSIDEERGLQTIIKNPEEVSENEPVKSNDTMQDAEGQPTASEETVVEPLRSSPEKTHLEPLTAPASVTEKTQSNNNRRQQSPHKSKTKPKLKIIPLAKRR
ncbi:MAG: hypothetical protein K2H84_03265 [Paramuribaculum sp.]|nr:hypothetical protein [Paramuribaculum sp.]